jgi:hypothetical protein
VLGEQIGELGFVAAGGVAALAHDGDHEPVFRLVLLSPEGTQIGGRSVAWIGFGLVLSALLVRTGWLALRGREHMELSAAAAGTLLVAAVWFQVIMSGARSEVELAAAFAVLAELPLAGVCLWIAGRAEFRRAERARIMIYLVQKLRRGRAAESLIRSARTGCGPVAQDARERPCIVSWVVWGARWMRRRARRRSSSVSPPQMPCCCAVSRA